MPKYQKLQHLYIISFTQLFGLQSNQIMTYFFLFLVFNYYKQKALHETQNIYNNKEEEKSKY